MDATVDVVADAAVGAMAEVDAEVAIVGYGPVGATLAVLLAQLGERVVVLERWPQPYPLPRAVHFEHDVGRILQSCGIGDELRAITEPAPTYEWRNGRGTTLLRYGRVGTSPSGWPLSSMFHQPTLEALLHRRAAQLDRLEVRRGMEVTGLEPLDDSVVVRTADGGAVRARIVVGCDGADSTVRRLAGLAVDDLGFSSDWLIVDVVLHEPRRFDPVNVQVCDPARPTSMVSGGPGRRRWEFMRLPSESLEELDDVRRAWDLLARWDVHPGNARLERHAVYTFDAAHAERWRAGRVLLAGDAAHLMPPFAGQGLCAGIRDVANLAWKLDLVLRDLAPEALLDTYQQERLPSTRMAIDFSVDLGRIICVSDPDEAAARDVAMAATVETEPIDAPDQPGIGAGVVDATSAGAGELFVQGTVGGRPFDDVHGAGWRLVTLDAEAVAPSTDHDRALEAWFGSIGGRVIPLVGPDANLGGWFARTGVTSALQRPDFHLYGTATNGTEVWRLLGALRRHLAGTPPA